MRKLIVLLTVVLLCFCLSSCKKLWIDSPDTQSALSDNADVTTSFVSNAVSSNILSSDTESDLHQSSDGHVSSKTSVSSKVTSSKKPQSSEPVSSKKPQSSEPVSSEKPEMTMTEYVAANKSEIDAVLASQETDNVTGKCYARKDSLVLSFTVAGTIEENEANAMIEMLDSIKSVYSNMLDEIREDVPDAHSVIIEYSDDSGVVISREYF